MRGCNLGLDWSCILGSSPKESAFHGKVYCFDLIRCVCLLLDAEHEIFSFCDG